MIHVLIRQHDIVPDAKVIDVLSNEGLIATLAFNESGGFRICSKSKIVYLPEDDDGMYRTPDGKIIHSAIVDFER